MYACEIHPVNKTVIRTVVAPSIEWCVENITTQVQTGVDEFDVPVFTPTFWLETADPYIAPGTLVYAGPGYGADPAVPERFALPWDETAATIPNELGQYAYATQGQVVFYEGKIWRNLLPDGNPNVFPPPTNWREYPMGLEHPVWVQPSGAFDAYPLDFVVEHEGGVWRSLNAANVWEPGTDPLLWEDITPIPDPPAIEAWQPWSGLNEDLYQVGDQVTHNGQTWQSNTPNNSWEPGEFGWDVI